jgi:hypothetical protein
MYSVNSMEAVKKIYSIGSKFPKSDWYYAWQHPDPDRWTVFPDRNMKRHAETRKRFQSMYSMSSLVNYEAYVDDCAEIFGRRLSEFAAYDDVIDMGRWFQLYAFDVCLRENMQGQTNIPAGDWRNHVLSAVRLPRCR